MDFVQYVGYDYRGNAMGKQWDTVPLRGFLRTDMWAGGTVRHIGVPYLGTSDAADRNCTGNEQVPRNCPGLDPFVREPDSSYDGSIYNGRQWGFNETDLLCAGGFTTLGPDGSPFTGDRCPANGTVMSSQSSKVTGPIPVTGIPMALGEQVVHYDCLPPCACDSTCADDEHNEHFQRVNVIHDFNKYLQDPDSPNSLLSDASGPARRGTKVPNEIARIGIYIHWLADRNSHYFCTDSGDSGIKIKPRDDATQRLYGGEYDLDLELDEDMCNWVRHGMMHMWEQGMVGDELEPAAYAALRGVYVTLQQFKADMEKEKENQWWFRSNATVYSFEDVVGTKQKPGVMYKATAAAKAEDRVRIFVESLVERGLPVLPGFEGMAEEIMAEK